jgi:hypothetical protein
MDSYMGVHIPSLERRAAQKHVSEATAVIKLPAVDLH